MAEPHTAEAELAAGLLAEGLAVLVVPRTAEAVGLRTAAAVGRRIAEVVRQRGRMVPPEAGRRHHQAGRHRQAALPRRRQTRRRTYNRDSDVRARVSVGLQVAGHVRHISTTTTVVIGVLIRLNLSKGRFQASTAFVTKLVVLVDCGCAPGASRAREGGHNHGTSEVILCLVLGDEVLDRRKIDVLVLRGRWVPSEPDDHWKY